MIVLKIIPILRVLLLLCVSARVCVTAAGVTAVVNDASITCPMIVHARDCILQ